MSTARTRPPSPEPPPEGENEVQRNIRLKVCAYCKAPGARKKCNGCRQRTYCNKQCQKNDWKTVHREQCEKLQQVFVPPPAGWREAKEAAERDEEEAGGGGGGAAAAAGGGGGAAADDDEFAHPCPICLDNEDDADMIGSRCGMCSACGQMYCGACKADALVDRSPNCPTCRAPFRISGAEVFKQMWKLVHDRSSGRHTPVAQCNLGCMYENGHGVKQDSKEAVAWYRKAAEQGYTHAQFNLGLMYKNGRGVKQDHKEAAMWYRKAAEQGDAGAQVNLGAMYNNGQGVPQDFAAALNWFQLAAEQGYEKASKALDLMRQHNLSLILPPSPGTAVTAILLTSAAGSKHNNTPGIVVTPTEGTVVKPGRVAVLLDGAAAPIAFKLMNLRVHPDPLVGAGVEDLD